MISCRCRKAMKLKPKQTQHSFEGMDSAVQLGTQRAIAEKQHKPKTFEKPTFSVPDGCTVLAETTTSEKMKSSDLGYSLCGIKKAKAKEDLWDFAFLRQCGLLLWLVRAQHVHYECECVCLSITKKQKREQIPVFS